MNRILILIGLFVCCISSTSSAQSLDLSFGAGGKAIRSQQSVVKSVTTQADGKILTAGFNFDQYHFEITRYHAGGTPDSTFGDDGVVSTPISFRSEATAIAVQDDGKILVGGTYYTGDFVNIYHIALVRYKTNGTPDSSFGTNGIVMQEVDYSVALNDMKIQPDGKIVVGGTVVPLSSIAVEHFLVARFNKDGRLDEGFGIGGLAKTASGIHSAIAEIELQQDGKIIAAGRRGFPSLIEPVDEVKFQLVRYLANGSIDLTFGNEGFVLTDVLPGHPDMIHTMGLQSDGKIIAAGCWEDSLTMVRYNIDGGIDSSFGTYGKSITRGYPAPLKLAIQDNDKLLFASGIPYDIEDGGDLLLGRFLANGIVDADFGTEGKVVTDVQSGSTDYSYAIHIQADGKVIVGGSSNNFGLLVRYMNDNPTSTEKIKQDKLAITCYPNPFSDYVLLKIDGLLSDKMVTVVLSNLSGQILSNTKIELANGGNKLSLPELQSGTYILTVVAANGERWSDKIVKIKE